MSIFPTKVLLATEGSKEADLAATTAADLAEKTNSELHIVTVAEDPYLATDFTLHFPEAAERHRQEVRKEVQAILASLRCEMPIKAGKPPVGSFHPTA
jgi:nucleotide-binding universal stress UspA family protein